jgi:hypothetical protein
MRAAATSLILVALLGCSWNQSRRNRDEIQKVRARVQVLEAKAADAADLTSLIVAAIATVASSIAGGAALAKRKSG